MIAGIILGPTILGHALDLADSQENEVIFTDFL